MRLQQPQWWHKASFLRRFQPSKFPSFSPKATLRKFFDASAFKSNQNKRRYAQESHGAWASTASELSAFSQASLAGPGTRNDGHKGAGSQLYILMPGILGSSWLIWNHDIKWPFAVIQTMSYSTIGTLHCRSFVVTIQLGCCWQRFIAFVVWALKLWSEETRWKKLPYNARIQPATGSTIAAKCFLESKKTATKSGLHNHL